MHKNILNDVQKIELEQLFMKYGMVNLNENFWTEFKKWQFRYLKAFILDSFRKGIATMLGSEGKKQEKTGTPKWLH